MNTNTLIIIIISIISSIALIGIFFKMKEGFGPFNLKVYGLTIVITIASLLVLSNVSSDQLTACFGLLGTIAGYLFGMKVEKKNTNKSNGKE